MAQLDWYLEEHESKLFHKYLQRNIIKKRLPLGYYPRPLTNNWHDVLHIPVNNTCPPDSKGNKLHNLFVTDDEDPYSPPGPTLWAEERHINGGLTYRVVDSPTILGEYSLYLVSYAKDLVDCLPPAELLAKDTIYFLALGYVRWYHKTFNPFGWIDKNIALYWKGYSAAASTTHNSSCASVGEVTSPDKGEEATAESIEEDPPKAFYNPKDDDLTEAAAPSAAPYITEWIHYRTGIRDLYSYNETEDEKVEYDPYDDGEPEPLTEDDEMEFIDE